MRQPPTVEGVIIDLREPVSRVCDGGELLWFESTSQLFALDPDSLRLETYRHPFGSDWKLEGVWGRIALATQSVATEPLPAWHWKAVDLSTNETLWEHQRSHWAPFSGNRSRWSPEPQVTWLGGLWVVDHESRNAWAILIPETGTLRSEFINERSDDTVDPLIEMTSPPWVPVECVEGPGFRAPMIGADGVDVPGEPAPFSTGSPWVIVTQDAHGTVAHFVDVMRRALSVRIEGTAQAVSSSWRNPAVVDGKGTLVLARSSEPGRLDDLVRVAVPAWVDGVSEFMVAPIYTAVPHSLRRAWVVLTGDTRVGLLNVDLLRGPERELQTRFWLFHRRDPKAPVADDGGQWSSHKIRSVDRHGVALVRHPSAGELVITAAEIGGPLRPFASVEIGDVTVSPGRPPEYRWRDADSLLEAGDLRCSLAPEAQPPAFLRLGLRKLWVDRWKSLGRSADPALDRLHEQWDAGPEQRQLLARALRVTPVAELHVLDFPDEVADAIGAAHRPLKVTAFVTPDGDWGYFGRPRRPGLHHFGEGETRPTMASTAAFIEARLLEAEARGDGALAVAARLLLGP